MKKTILSILLLVLLCLYFSCNDKSQHLINERLFVRFWTNDELNMSISDTVKNLFVLTQRTNNINLGFEESIFVDSNLGKWVSVNRDGEFCKTIFKKRVLYDNESLEVAKCVYSIDTTSESNSLRLIFIQKYGLLFKKGYHERESYILNKIKKEDSTINFKFDVFLKDSVFFTPPPKG